MMRISTGRHLTLMLLLAGGLATVPANFAAAAAQGSSFAVEGVGFRGTYKVGYWTPLWVRAPETDARDATQFEVTASDSDGVPMTVRVPASTTAGEVAADGDGSATLIYTKVGRIDSAMEVSLTANGKIVARQTLAPSELLSDDSLIRPLRATSQLIVQVGATPLGIREAYPDREAGVGELGRQFVPLESLKQLPIDWFGYDAVDVLVLATGDGELFAQLAADERRLAAIERWLETSGRLVVACGRSAPELIAPGKPLERFLPAKFISLERLPQTRGLENFAETPDPIGGVYGRTAIQVPRLTDVAGTVDVDGRGGDLPLVIRAPRGFGELVFVGVDFEVTPLAEWSGRTEFWRGLLRPYLADVNVGESQSLVSHGYDDLAGAVRQRLGRSFRGVAPVTFPIVALLAIGYLALLGPLDYLFVHKFVRRPGIAWITFPVLVLACSGGLTWLAAARRASGTIQVNQAEVVDVDAATGQARGSYWATLYSPSARRFDLTVAPRLPDGTTPQETVSRVSWLGLPGAGRGGMHARGIDLDPAQTDYQLAAELNALSAVPLLTSSTKSFAAGWTGSAGRLLNTDLVPNDDGLLVGSIANETGVTLRDACLLYGGWGYRLPDFEAGQSLDVGPQLSAIQVRTLLARRAGQSTRGLVDRNLFSVDRASTDELLNVMMFYEAVGGASFVGLPSQYEARCDLSRLLVLGRAILIAQIDDGGSRLVDQSANAHQPIPINDSTVLYRFVIPIAPGPWPLTPDP
jgi:hypothetical protein